MKNRNDYSIPPRGPWEGGDGRSRKKNVTVIPRFKMDTPYYGSGKWFRRGFKHFRTAIPKNGKQNMHPSQCTYICVYMYICMYNPFSKSPTSSINGVFKPKTQQQKHTKHNFTTSRSNRFLLKHTEEQILKTTAKHNLKKTSFFLLVKQVQNSSTLKTGQK